MSGNGRGGIEARDPRSGRTLWTRPGAGRSIGQVELLAAGTRVAVVERDGTLLLLDGGTGSVLAETTGVVRLEDDSSDGRLLAIRRPTDRLAVVATADLGEIWAPHLDREVQSAAFFAAGGESLLVAAGGEVALHHLGSGARGFALAVGAPVLRLEVAPDRKRFCVADQRSGLALYDAAGRCIKTLRATGQRGFATAFSMAFTGDGRRLATFNRDHTVRIWDVARGTQLLAFADQPWSALCFAAGDQSLLATYREGDRVGIRIWDAPAGAAQLIERRR